MHTYPLLTYYYLHVTFIGECKSEVETFSFAALNWLREADVRTVQPPDARALLHTVATLYLAYRKAVRPIVAGSAPQSNTQRKVSRAKKAIELHRGSTLSQA